MPRMKKTWAEKMNAKPPHSVMMDKDFAGIKKGSRLLISSPQQVADYLRSIPIGETMVIQQLRRELAKQNGADATCPVSTSIFLRVVAEHNWERFQAGTPVAQLDPFWRVVEPTSPLAQKLSFDSAWIALQRELEHGAESQPSAEVVRDVVPPKVKKKR